MQELPAALADLFEALERHGRADARADADDQARTSVEVGGHVAHVVGLAGRAPVGEGPPPRGVATAMARALFASPHLSQTLSVYTTASEHVTFHPTPQLSEILQLEMSELEEIRAAVDVEVADFLKQSRAMHWLWHRAGNPRVAPEPMWHMLFPGVERPQADHFAYRGGRLYAVIDQPHPPPKEGLYMPWLPGSERWTAVPDTHFAARYLDASLLRGCGRAIGAQPDEITRILDRLVCVVPKEGESEYVRHDRWRSEGWARLTGLGNAQPGSAWLTLRLAPDAIAADGWLEHSASGLTLRAPGRVFDRHAMGRVTSMLDGIIAEVFARGMSGMKLEGRNQAQLVDLGVYLQRVLEPLLSWAQESRTHAHLAEQVQTETRHVGAAMSQVRDAWRRSAHTSWGGVPTEQRPWTVQGILAAHIAVTQASLFRTFHREEDERAAHGRVLMLFAATYLREAPLGRLWKPVDGKLPPVEDVIGTWFWVLWQRLLDSVE